MTKKAIAYLTTAIVIVLSLTSCGGDTRAVAAVDVIAFINVDVVPMTAEIVLENQTVLVEGNRIAKMGRTNTVNVPKNALVIDGTGGYLMPGLADMHTHSQDDWVGSDNWPVSPLSLFLVSGVTTIRDCGHVGDISLPLRWRDEIDAGSLDGPTMYTTGNVMWGDHRGLIYEGVVQDQIDQGFDFLKLKASFSEDFHSAVEEANQLGVYTVGHIPYQVGLEGVLSAGLDEIAHVEEFYFDYLAIDPTLRLTDEAWFSRVIETSTQLFESNPGRLSMDDIEEIYGEAISGAVDQVRSAGALVGTTAALNEIVDQKVNDPEAFLARSENRYLSRDCRDRVRKGQDRHQLQIGELERRGVAHLLPAKFMFDRVVLDKLREAGVALLLAPDSGGRELCVVPGYSTHDELRVLVEYGFTPYEAIRMATVNAARAVESMTGEGDFGTIEVGNRADLILVSGNPLEDVANIRDARGVMAAGRWYSRETLEQMMAAED